MSVVTQESLKVEVGGGGGFAIMELPSKDVLLLSM